MMILALDIATNTGFAYGDSHCKKPISGSVRLKKPKETILIAPYHLFSFLRDMLDLAKIRPDLVFAEQYMNPAGHKSADSVVTQLMSHGAMQAWRQELRFDFQSAMPNAIRKHFIGIGAAPKPKKDEPKLPPDWIKHQVRMECVRRRYVDHSCKDLDRTDALAAWDYAATLYGGRQEVEE